MSVLVLDSGAFVAVERLDRAVLARIRAAQADGFELHTNAMVVAQVWRGGTGRRAPMATLLQGVDVHSVTEEVGRRAGVLLGKSKTADAVDPTVALMARTGDRVLTSDPRDLKRLLRAAGIAAVVVPC